MARTAIDAALASSALEVRVRFCETDFMGIVHHSTYLAYFEAGRIEWLRRRGVTYADCVRDGLHLAVVEANVRYRAPARFDEVLSLETRLAELRSHSLRFEYTLRRDEDVLCEGATRLASLDDAQRLRRLPEDMLPILVSGERA